MDLKSISETPSLISPSVTPVPTPGTSAAVPPVPGAVVDDAFELLVPLPHPAAITSAATTKPTFNARILRTLRERDEIHHVIGPVVDGAVGHHEHAVGRQLL